MPAALGIGTAIAGVFQAVGAHKQANASRDAARMESDYNNRALDFAKKQYAAEETRRAPYRQAAQDYMAWKGNGSQAAPVAAYKPQTLKAFSDEPQPFVPVNAGSIREFYRG